MRFLCGITKRLVIVLIAGYVSLALGDEPAQPPAPPAVKKRAVALGYAGSTVGVDVPRDGDKKLDPGGWGVLGRVDLRQGWGLQLGYSRKEDRIGSGGEMSLAQAGHAYYAWEGELGDSLWLRFYPKFGVSRTDFEETVPLTETFSDDAIGPSFGFAVEWGSPSWRLVFDAGWTFVDVELIPGQKESLNVSAGFFGLAYCF
jgi:opacity protein-like surface antigen